MAKDLITSIYIYLKITITSTNRDVMFLMSLPFHFARMIPKETRSRGAMRKEGARARGSMRKQGARGRENGDS